MNRVVLGCAVGLGLFGVAACSSAPASSPTPATTPATTFTVVGTVDIVGGSWAPSDYVTPNAPCGGTGGFADVAPGQQVVAVDQVGTTVAIGSITGGVSGKSLCRMTFAINGVPSGKSFYSVKLGRHGAPQYTEAQFRAGIAPSLTS